MMNIAFFDSGIGGLTVLKEAHTLLPYENYIYYADTQNVPYGIKSKEEIKEYILDAVHFLSGKNIKILVIACNTATSVAISDIRAKYKFPIIGMEPAIKPAIEKNINSKVLVLATALTLYEQKFENLVKDIDKEHKIDKLALDELVIFAEKYDFSSVKVKEYIKEKLDPIKFEEYETVVLGCTHFIFYKTIIQEFLPTYIDVIDGNLGTVNNMINLLKRENLLAKDQKSSLSFYSSGIQDNNNRSQKLKEFVVK